MNRYINKIIEALDFAKIESARIIHRCEEIEKMIDKLCKYYKMDNEVLTDLHNISSVFRSIVENEIHIDNICKILPKTANQVIMAVMQKDWEYASINLGQFVGQSYTITKDKDADGKEIDTATHIR